MSSTTRFHEMLRWSAEDLADAKLSADTERLARERLIAAERLLLHMDEVVQLAWRQLQADHMPSPEITAAEVRALMNHAQTGMFLNAIGGSESVFNIHRASYKALHSLLQGSGKKALAFNASKGGYVGETAFQGVWSPLPDGFENFSLAQVTQHLCAHGVKVTLDTVADSQSDAVIKLKDGRAATIECNDEHDSARADVGNGSGMHGSIVSQGGVA